LRVADADTKAWRRQAMQRSEDWREQNARADKAESALAALRKRVEEATILEPYESIAFGFGNNKLALVVLGEG